MRYQNESRKGIRKIPGFRSNTLWKKILALIIYFFIVAIAVAALIEDGLPGLFLFAAMLAIPLSFIALIKGNLRSAGIPNRKIAGLVLAVSFILTPFLLMFVEAPAESDAVTSDLADATEEIEQELPEEPETTPSKPEDTEENADTDSLEAERAAEEHAEAKAEEERLAEEAEEQAQAEAEAEAEAAAKRAEEERLAKAAAEKERAEQEAKAAAAEKARQENAPNATVTRVVDGDTLEVSMNGTTETVRLLLVDTPETVHPNEPVQPFGPEASQFVKDTLTGQEVRVKVGTEERDNYGRMLAYVYIGDETIQEKLLENGLAATAYLYNDLSMLNQFHAAQQTAIDAGIGVWSIPGYAHVDHNHGFHYEEAPAPQPEPEPEPAPQPEPAPSTRLEYDPFGPDRDCGDFSSQAAAQAFMEAAGAGDPHRLDGNDNDGLACESLG